MEASYPAAGTVKMQQFVKKVDVGSPYNPAIPLLSVYPKELKTCVQTKTCTLVFIAAIFVTAKK